MPKVMITLSDEAIAALKWWSDNMPPDIRTDWRTEAAGFVEQAVRDIILRSSPDSDELDKPIPF